MSRGLVCDQCGGTLLVDQHGEDEAGESAAWLKIVTTFGSYDVCTRSCAVALIESDDFAAAVDAQTEAIAEVVRAINGADEDDE